jgi:hypothetical protein
MRRVKIAFALILLFITTALTNAYAEAPTIIRPKAASISIHQGIAGSTIGQAYINSRFEVIETKGEWTKVKLEAWVQNKNTIEVSNDDKTQTIKKDALQIISHKIKTHPAPVNKVYLSIIVKNTSATVIKSWKAFLVAKDNLGREAIRTVITDDSADLPPGGAKETGFYWDTTEKEYDTLQGANDSDYSFSLQGAILNGNKP